MLIKDIIAEDIHDDKSWARANMPGGSADPHKAETDELLDQLAVDGKRPQVELTTVGEIIKGGVGRYRGIYLLFSRSLLPPHTQPEYIYIGLAGDNARSAGLIADRWSKQHFKAYSGELKYFFNAATNSSKSFERDGVLYYNASSPDYGKPFPEWAERESKYFLTDKSYKELMAAISKYEDKKAWEPNKKNGQYIDPRTGEPTKDKWIRARDFIRTLKLEKNPDRDINQFPVALVNLNEYAPWAVKYAEATFINIYDPAGNAAHPRAEWRNGESLTTSDEHKAAIQAKAAGKRVARDPRPAATTKQRSPQQQTPQTLAQMAQSNPKLGIQLVQKLPGGSNPANVALIKSLWNQPLDQAKQTLAQRGIDINTVL